MGIFQYRNIRVSLVFLFLIKSFLWKENDLDTVHHTIPTAYSHSSSRKCVLPTLFIWKYWSKISGKSIPCFGCKGLMGKGESFSYFHGLNWSFKITITSIDQYILLFNFHAEGCLWDILYVIHCSAVTIFIGPHLS